MFRSLSHKVNANTKYIKRKQPKTNVDEIVGEKETSYTANGNVN
jgi:hypothetical protein